MEGGWKQKLMAQEILFCLGLGHPSSGPLFGDLKVLEVLSFPHSATFIFLASQTLLWPIL